MRTKVKSLGETEIYKYLNTSNDNISKAILETYVTGKDVRMDSLEGTFDRISRYSYPLKNSIINAEFDRLIKIKYNEGMHKVPPFLPAYTIAVNKEGNTFQTIADITAFATQNKDGKIRIIDKDLYAILTQAYLTKSYYVMSFNTIRNLGTVHDVAKAYGLLMLKVFNKLFGLSTNSLHRDKVHYAISKFYYLNVLGYENSTEELNNKCMSLVETQNPKLVRDIDNYMSDEDYKSLEGFLGAIAKNIPVCSKLTLSSFVSSFTTTYGTGSIFAIEFLPTLLTLIVFVMEGSYLTINTANVEKVIDRQVSSAYKSIVSALKD